MVASLTAWLGSFFERLGLRAHTGEVCESKEMRCPADTSVTALQVHFGRDERYDRDFYDFKLRCGTRWQRYLGLRFESPDKEQEESVLCPGIKPASGIQVLRGRQKHGDKDYYGFKLRCAALSHQRAGLTGLEAAPRRDARTARQGPRTLGRGAGSWRRSGPQVEEGRRRPEACVGRRQEAQGPVRRGEAEGEAAVRTRLGPAWQQ